jgi:Flp pilus assembly protein TadG
MDKMRRWVRNERGSILLFTTVLVLPLMIIIGGLAMDLAYLGTVDDELGRSMDAAALAGAGNLGSSASAFTGDSSPVRLAAQTYAISNPYRAENTAKQITTTTFTPNDNNADPTNGNIIVGIWNGTTRTFTPSLDGTSVNAVKCQYASTIPTSFLKLIPGLNSLFTAAQAIAISGPPATLCPGCCAFPIGVTQCPFQDAGGNFGSQGCGQPVATFTPATTNTAAWINVNGLGTPNKPNIQAAVDAAAAGICPNTSLQSGSQVGTNNGEVQSVFDTLAKCNGSNCKNEPGTTGYFIDKYNSGPVYTTRDSNDNITYQGQGWEVFVPVIKTSCPAGPINGDHQILTFSRLVITQVIDHGRCAVQNHAAGNIWDAQCPTPNGTCTTCTGGSLNAVFGYFRCAEMDAPPTPIPAPIAGLATKVKLVK